MENSLQAVMDMARDFEINEPAAVIQAREIAADPAKDLGWYRRSADYVKALRNQEARVEDELGPIKRANYKAYKLVKDLMDRLIDPREKCRGIVCESMSAWKKEEDARAKNEEIKMLQEATAVDDEERLRAAELLEKQGNHALANAIISEAGFVPPVFLREVKVDGIKHKKRWRARVQNKRDLIHAVEKDPGLMDAVKVDQAWLDKYVDEHDGKVIIGGVEPYEEDSIEVRRSA